MRDQVSVLFEGTDDSRGVLGRADLDQHLDQRSSRRHVVKPALMLDLDDIAAERTDALAEVRELARPVEDLHPQADQTLRAQEVGSGNVIRFHELVAEKELPGLLKASTIQIIPQELGFSHGAFPSKAPNLVAAGTAIFGITDCGSELLQILKLYSKGTASHSWDLESNLKLLQDLADIEQIDSSGANANDDQLCRQFDVASLCQIIDNY